MRVGVFTPISQKVCSSDPGPARSSARRRAGAHSSSDIRGVQSPPRGHVAPPRHCPPGGCRRPCFRMGAGPPARRFLWRRDKIPVSGSALNGGSPCTGNRTRPTRTRIRRGCSHSFARPRPGAGPRMKSCSMPACRVSARQVAACLMRRRRRRRGTGTPEAGRLGDVGCDSVGLLGHEIKRGAA